jgi:hypothetical protein
MSNIPVSKSSASASGHPIGPVKPTPIPITPVTSTSAFKVVKTFKTAPGSHIVEVRDYSYDKNQFLPFMAHCNTCAYEARTKTVDEAINYANTHSQK